MKNILTFKLFESPDNVVYNGKTLDVYDRDARPFEWDTINNIIYLGGYRNHHKEDGELGDSYPGRIWDKSKIITFWVYPDKETFEKICQSFEIDHNIKILNNDWKIGIIKTENGEIKRKNQNDNLYLTVDWEEFTKNNYKEEIIPVEQYIGSESVPEEEYLMHLQKPIDKKDNAKDRISGWKPKTNKFKMPGESEIEAKRRLKYMYQEKLTHLKKFN